MLRVVLCLYVCILLNKKGGLGIGIEVSVEFFYCVSTGFGDIVDMSNECVRRMKPEGAVIREVIEFSEHLFAVRPYVRRFS